MAKMPLRLEIKKKLASRSERVKCVHMHPTKPWVLSALYNGTVMIWNYETQTLVKTLRSDRPAGALRQVCRAQAVDNLRIQMTCAFACSTTTLLKSAGV